MGQGAEIRRPCPAPWQPHPDPQAALASALRAAAAQRCRTSTAIQPVQIRSMARWIGLVLVALASAAWPPPLIGQGITATVLSRAAGLH